MKLIAKSDTWFDKGTEVELLQEITSLSGLFLGTRNGKPDEEVCRYDEFEEIEDDLPNR